MERGTNIVSKFGICHRSTSPPYPPTPHTFTLCLQMAIFLFSSKINHSPMNLILHAMAVVDDEIHCKLNGNMYHLLFPLSVYSLVPTRIACIYVMVHILVCTPICVTDI